MHLLNRNQLEKNYLQGRIIQNAVGKNAPVISEKMTMGFATYCEKCGVMEPHHHAEEIVYILCSEKGYFRYGESCTGLGERIPLSVGMTLHFKELEWHVFEYDTGGKIEIIFFYGQTENIRPEEIYSNIISATSKPKKQPKEREEDL